MNLSPAEAQELDELMEFEISVGESDIDSLVSSLTSDLSTLQSKTIEQIFESEQSISNLIESIEQTAQNVTDLKNSLNEHNGNLRSKKRYLKEILTLVPEETPESVVKARKAQQVIKLKRELGSEFDMRDAIEQVKKRDQIALSASPPGSD